MNDAINSAETLGFFEGNLDLRTLGSGCLEKKRHNPPSSCIVSRPFGPGAELRRLVFLRVPFVSLPRSFTVEPPLSSLQGTTRAQSAPLLIAGRRKPRDVPESRRRLLTTSCRVFASSFGCSSVMLFSCAKTAFATFFSPGGVGRETALGGR